MIITGASSGIGRDLALLLADQGDQLILVARREGLLKALALECEQRGAGKVLTVTCDVGIPEQTKQLIPAIKALEPGELCLVNNAGSALFEPVDQMPQELFEQIVRANLLGMMFVTHEVLPLMLEEGNGQILNVLSIAATTAFSGSSAYCAAKAGAHMFAKCLALEVRKKGIRVTNIHPGATDTPIWDATGWRPEQEMMLKSITVAEVIGDTLNAPRDRSFDDVYLMPPLGIA